MQKSLSDSIAQRTALEDAFAKLSRQDRQAAYEIVRAKVGPKSISVIELMAAHKSLKVVS